MLSKISKFVTAFVCIALLVGCDNRGGSENGERAGFLRDLLRSKNDEVPLESFSPEEIYQQAQQLFAQGEAEKAATRFAEIERLYPYSEFAPKGLVQSAFANYHSTNYEQAQSDAQRYLDIYPAEEDAAFASYIIALSWYDQIDDVSRDQGVAFRALQALLTTVERYPDSKYARSATLKFDLALDHLAGKEMDVGRFYLRRGHYGAAISRFRVVVEEYETTSHTPEALHRLVESYLSLGLFADAQTAGAILGHNLQGTDWYEDSYF